MVKINTELRIGRIKRVALSAIAEMCNKGIRIIITLLTVPVLLRYFGKERYGIWLVISSFISMARFSDLGISNGLINAIANANGNDDQRSAKSYVSSSFLLVTASTFILTGLFYVFFNYFPWGRIINIESGVILEEAKRAIMIFAGFLSVNIILGIVQKVQIGYQEGYIDSCWQILGSLIVLCGYLIVVRHTLDLSCLVIAFLGGEIISRFLNGCHLFIFRKPWLRPSLETVKKSSIHRLFHIGSLFFILQLAGAVGFQADNLIVANLLGASNVPTYAVPFKLFSLIPMMLSFVLTPLWPAYGEAITRKEYYWIKKVFYKSIKLTLLVSIIPSFVLLIWGGDLIRLWVGSMIVPPFNLYVGLGLWAIINCFSGPIAMFLNGASIIRFQLICAIVMSICNIILSIYLVKKIGVAGAIWGTDISLILFIIIPSIIYIKKLFNKWDNEERLHEKQ